jgi:hypothetical protein
MQQGDPPGQTRGAMLIDLIAILEKAGDRLGSHQSLHERAD